MFRFVICVDVKAENLVKAYSELYARMSETGLGWESTDEAYDSDGYVIEPKILQRACEIALSERGA